MKLVVAVLQYKTVAKKHKIDRSYHQNTRQDSTYWEAIMVTMKKAITACLATVMLLGCASCGSGSTNFG